MFDLSFLKSILKTGFLRERVGSIAGAKKSWRRSAKGGLEKTKKWVTMERLLFEIETARVVVRLNYKVL